MKCQICGKNDASHQYFDVVGDKKTIVHVCESCAQQSGALDSMTTIPVSMKSKSSSEKKENPLIAITDIFSLDKILKKCQHCGWTYETFRKKGRLGCPHCYRAFDTYLESIFSEIQGGIEHTGKRPLQFDQSRLSRALQHQRELETLNRKLEQAIQTESFEQAAELRDMIQGLTEKYKKTTPDLN